MNVVEVTAAVIESEGRVLLAQRPAGCTHPGLWEFPGGKVEPGESHRECLARELAEEMGIEVEAGERIAVLRHAYHELTIDLIAFRCTILKGEPRDIGCADHAWVTTEELDAYDMLPPDRKLAEMLRKP